MIDTTLTFVRDLLNEKFKNEFDIRENKVVLSNLIRTSGSIVENENKIVFFLISLDEETTLKNHLNRTLSKDSERFAQTNPAINLNLRVLFCANFSDKNYEEGLSYLSSLISFFKSNNRIQLNNNSEVPKNTLSFELCRMDYNEMSHLWSAIGSKLMPSVLYKIKLIAFKQGPVKKRIPPVRATEGQS